MRKLAKEVRIVNIVTRDPSAKIDIVTHRLNITFKIHRNYSLLCKHYSDLQAWFNDYKPIFSYTFFYYLTVCNFLIICYNVHGNLFFDTFHNYKNVRVPVKKKKYCCIQCSISLLNKNSLDSCIFTKIYWLKILPISYDSYPSRCGG